MKIIYTPQDNPVEGREEIDADLTSLWVGEVKLLEKTLKMTFQEIGEQLERGSATHLMAIVWIYRRRQNMDLRIDDMDDVMRLSEVEIIEDDEEVEEAADPKGDDPATPVVEENPAA